MAASDHRDGAEWAGLGSCERTREPSTYYITFGGRFLSVERFLLSSSHVLSLSVGNFFDIFRVRVARACCPWTRRSCSGPALPFDIETNVCLSCALCITREKYIFRLRAEGTMRGTQFGGQTFLITHNTKHRTQSNTRGAIGQRVTTTTRASERLVSDREQWRSYYTVASSRPVS